MSRSHRTVVPRVAAQRRLKRAVDGAIILPRIVERRPEAGDRHPLPASVLRVIMRREIPPEYLYGLDRIELRPRQEGGIGMPFGCYFRDEKAIILYSLPMSWVWHEPPAISLIRGMQRFFAYVKQDSSDLHVIWPAPEALCAWYFIEVFAHELGHHYQHQYRMRRGGAKDRRHDELVAELHSTRFYEALIARLKPRQ